MAASRIRRRASLENANGRRENDSLGEVSAGQTCTEEEAADDRQTRERLADYFAILREWDLRLRHNESQEVPEIRQP